MEPTPDQRRTLAAGTAPADRQLPSGENKLERIAQHSKGLVDELTDWVELRIKLAQVEIEEKVDAKVNKILVLAIIGVLALLTGLFALVALALGLGAWLGHPGWGFLAVTVLLALLTGGLRLAQPHLVDVGDKKAAVSEDHLSPASRRP